MLFIIIALAVVGLGLYFMSSGVGLLGWILIIGGGIFVIVVIAGDIGKAKSKMPKKTPKSSSSSSYSSSSSSSPSGLSDYEYEIRDYVKYNLRSLSDIYWEDVDSNSSGSKIYITVHYKKKDNGYNYVASDSDVQNAVGNAVRSAIKKIGCPYSVSYSACCDEIYTNM